MAQGVVIRFKADSTEYDAKLKRSIEQMKSMEDQARKLNGTVDRTDESYIKFVQSLGSMETKAGSAKGKINEMTQAFVELSVQYNKLTKDEKSSAYGRALSSSLDQLKGRIKGAKSELSGIEGQLSGFGDVAKNMAGKLGLPVEQLAKFGPYGAAAAAALKVAKDAFMSTEGNIDAWGQAVEGAKGAYSVFLDTLNNGNWSNFFSNLKTAITGASKLYDEMDRLSSIKANNAAAIAKEQATIQELRLRQQKGENVAEQLRAAEERLRKLQTESVDQGKTVGRDQMRQAIINSVNSIKGNGSSFLGINFRKDTTAKVSDEQIDAAIDEILNNGQAAMDKYAKAFKDLQTKGTKTWTETQYSQGGVAYQVTKSEFDINQLSAEEQALYKLSKAITDTEAKLGEGIQTYANALQEGASSARESFQTERFAQKGEKAMQVAVEPVLPEGSAAALRKKISELQKQWDMATSDDERSGIQKQIDDAQKALDTMSGKLKDMPPVEVPITFSEKGISDLGKQIKDNMAGLEIGSGDYLIAASNLLDFTTFENLLKTATENGLKIDNEWFASLFEDIKVGADVDPESWNALVDSLNKQLADLGLPPIVLDVDTGAVTQAQKKVVELKDSWEMLADGVGAIDSLVGSLDNLKSIGEDLTSVINGEKDAWDSFMTIMQSGISIIQTVISIKEALNALDELGIALSDKKAIAAGTEAAAVVAGKGAEVTAETTETGVAATATGVHAGLAASEAGSSMAGIPIVGPILAVAAIAAVLAAVIASVAKAKSAAPKYAMGGIVPGNSMSGDNVPAFVNSGELILSKSQQNTLAGQLNSNPMGNMRLSTEISGNNLRVVLNNDNRSRGGSRDIYGVH